jgi:O-antigen/teichoic acid export membrane protein
VSPAPRPAAAAGPRHQPGVLHTLGLRLAGHSAIYVLGGLLSAVYGLTQIVVLTRVLPVDGYGRLAVLVLYSHLITTICNLGFVTGTMLSLPFSGGGGGGGGMDEDGDGDDEVEDDRAARRPAGDPRKLLGTGMSIALLLTAALTGLSAVLAGPLARLLGDPHNAEAVVWATAAGGLGTVWRMVTSVPRLERRPGRYVALQGGYWAISLGAAAALASSGFGVAGAMAGITIGHLAACALGLALAWHKFRPAWQRSAVGHLGRRGLPYATITLPGFVTRHADLFILTMYVPHRELALYGVATRFTRIPSLAAGSAVLAFGPIFRGPMRAALDRKAAGDFARERIFSYYLILATFNVLALAIWAHVIVGIVPAGYADAALLIQLFALVAALHGAQGIFYRMSRFPGKIRRLRQIVWVSAVLTLGGALLLTPPFGVYGAIGAAALAPLVGFPTLLLLSQRGPTPLPLSGARILRCLGIAGVCFAAAYLARPLPHQAELLAAVLITLAFPVLLVATGVVPLSEVTRLAGLVRGLWAPRSERARLRAELATLDAADLGLLRALAIGHDDPDALGERLGVRGDDVRRRFVALMRSLGPGGEPTRVDVRVADVLLSQAPRSHRDGLGLQLSMRGHVEPLEFDRLGALLEHLRRLPAATWARADVNARQPEVRAGLAEAEPPAAM